MNCPNDIPQDIWIAVRDIPIPFGHETVARVIAAERERCAKIADEQASREEYGHAKHAAVTIAQNIRNG